LNISLYRYISQMSFFIRGIKIVIDPICENPRAIYLYYTEIYVNHVKKKPI